VLEKPPGHVTPAVSFVTGIPYHFFTSFCNAPKQPFVSLIVSVETTANDTST